MYCGQSGYFLNKPRICAIFGATPVSVGSVIDILLNCCVYISSVLILLEKNLFSRIRVQVSFDRYLSG